ncbi:MAG: hypothetical protein RCO49_00035 [Rickettsia endosymbiont of Argas persicus]
MDTIAQLNRLFSIALAQHDNNEELRKKFLNDVVRNKKLSLSDQFNLANQIAANNGIYKKDDEGNIIIDNTNLNNNIKPPSYTSNFNPNYQYKILYSTPTEILEKDITSKVIDIVKGFEKDSKGNSYTKFDTVVLKQMEQTRVYDLVKSEAESLIKSAYGKNIEYVDYYDNNIGGNSYEKYFTKYEKDTITQSLGYKHAFMMRKQS